MTYTQTILAGFALLAMALVFSAVAQTRDEGGPFEGVMTARAVSTGDLIWRLNKQTGAVSICYGPNVREAPSCSPWSR